MHVWTQGRWQNGGSAYRSNFIIMRALEGQMNHVIRESRKTETSIEITRLTISTSKNTNKCMKILGQLKMKRQGANRLTKSKISKQKLAGNYLRYLHSGLKTLANINTSRFHIQNGRHKQTQVISKLSQASYQRSNMG